MKTNYILIVVGVIILILIVANWNKIFREKNSTSSDIKVDTKTQTSSISTDTKTNTSGKPPVVNTSTPSCNPNAERMIVRDCNWQNPIHDGCTYVKKDVKPGTNNTMCYWFKQ